MDNFTPGMSGYLIRYIDGELTEEEHIKMKQQLLSDITLKQELDNLLSTREAVRHFGLQQKVADVHRQMMEEKQTPVKSISSTRRFLRYAVSIAAGFFLLIGGYIGYNFFTLTPEKVFSSRYQAFELSTVRNGGITESKLEQAFRSKKFVEVSEQVKANNTVSVNDLFLGGMANMELKNYSAAIEHLKKLINENKQAGTNTFNDEAEYYLALAYIENKDYDFALDMLKKIKETPGHIYYDKVNAKLIRQVKMLKWR